MQSASRPVKRLRARNHCDAQLAMAGGMDSPYALRLRFRAVS